jgi:hypothetical protein
MKHLIGGLILAALIGLPSCSLFGPSDKTSRKKEEAAQTKLVGRIASVSLEGNYVMIQSYGPWNVATGSILTTQGPDNRVSNLRCSGEKLGQYSAADIQSGVPQIGDAVFTTLDSPSKPGNPATPKNPEGFTPSFNSGSGSAPQLPQVP